MKTLILAALLLCSCDTLNTLNEVAVPVTAAASIAGSIEDILLASDLDGDGDIQGSTEWLAFVLAVYEAVFNQEWNGPQEPTDPGH